MSKIQDIKNKLTNQDLATIPMPQTIAGMLRDPRFLKKIEAALPEHMTPDRMAKIALIEIRKNNKLSQCNPNSLFGAIIQSSQLGLEIGSGLGHAYLVPFNNKKQKRTDIQLIIGYRGMTELARRSGQVISLQAHTVYEADEFELSYGLDERLHHIPTRHANKGEMIGAYAVAKLVGGGHQIKMMWKHEIDKVKKDSDPWKFHYDEMAKKTVIRQLFKFLPISVEVQRASILDELADAGENQNNEEIFDVDDILEGEFTQEPNN